MDFTLTVKVFFKRQADIMLFFIDLIFSAFISWSKEFWSKLNKNFN